MATWSEGSKNYLVAEMNMEHVYSDESKYRCFVYEKQKWRKLRTDVGD